MTEVEESGSSLMTDWIDPPLLQRMGPAKVVHTTGSAMGSTSGSSAMIRYRSKAMVDDDGGDRCRSRKGAFSE